MPPGLPLNENWVDNFDAKTKEEYITIDYAEEKGNLENIFSRNGYKIAFILIHNLGLSGLCASKNPCRVKIKAHGGFMRITAIPDSKDEKSLISQIKEALKWSNSNATYVTGHSLGGAMAVITSGTV